MKLIETGLPGVIVLAPRVHGDHRGFFLETWREDAYAELLGTGVRFVQDNHSRSRRGVLRGLHFQTRRPQGKLVRCVQGEVFDVAVDVRPDSPTFGRWAGVTLSADNHHQIWVPPGFAHGFQVLSESADIEYKCTDYYDPEGESGLIWNDPEVGIAWPSDDVALADKDARLPALADLAGRAGAAS